jgi:hypothetical protein
MPVRTQTSDPIGLLAGAGELPLLFARRAREKGVPLVVAALKGSAPRSLVRAGEPVLHLQIGQLGALLSFFRRHGVRRAVMLGKVQHSSVLRGIPFDLKALAVVARLKDRSGPALLRALAAELMKAGVRVLDSRTMLREALSPRGVLTRKGPDASQARSAAYGLKRARALARWGVGQTLVVKRCAVVAVEAAEGTDGAIRRAGRVAGKGCVAVKVAAQTQDWRFDVPTVGPATLRTLAAAKAAGLVIEAGRTFILRKSATLALADRHGLFVLAV